MQFLEIGSSKKLLKFPIGVNCAPLLTDLFLNSQEAEFTQTCARKKKKSLTAAFYSTSRNIDDVLSINTYVDSIYPMNLI